MWCVLTCHSKVPDHLVSPFQEILHLQALIFPPKHRRQVLVLESVERARVLERLRDTRAGLDIAANELPVELLLGCWELDGRHDNDDDGPLCG